MKFALKMIAIMNTYDDLYGNTDPFCDTYSTIYVHFLKRRTLRLQVELLTTTHCSS